MNDSNFKEKPTRGKGLGGILSIVFSVILVVVLFVQFNPEKIWELIKNAKMFPLLPITGLYLLAHLALTSERYRQVLSGMGIFIRFSEAVVIRMGCSPIKFFAPLKSGELLKAIYLKRNFGVPFAEGVSSVAFDKVAVLMGLMPYFFVASILSGQWLLVLVTLGLAVAGAALFLPSARNVVLRIGKIFGPKIAGLTQKLISSYARISWLRGLWIFFLAIVMQGIEFVLFITCLNAAGVSAPFGTIFYALVLSSLISLIPITASGIGAREASLVYLLADVSAKPMVLAGGLLFSIFGRVVLHMSGIFWMPRFLHKVFSGAESDQDASQREASGGQEQS